MSSYEYNDLFYKCQDKGLYHVFTFDIKDSKKLRNSRNEVQKKLIKLSIMVYKSIQRIEVEQNKKILVFEQGFKNLESSRLEEFGYKYEPFNYGDLIGFTVYRGSISKEEVIKIFNDSKEFLNIDFAFHINDGYYETNDWIEANEKYFRGHCIDFLSNQHKTDGTSIDENNKNQKIK